MENRLKDLLEIRQFTQSAETELTMILQSLQWDKNTLAEKPAPETCKFDPGHKVPLSSKICHESRCFLHHHGYSTNDIFLPDALEIAGNSLVKLNNEQIKTIIDKAAQNDPLFKKGTGQSSGSEPLTLDRLQCTYTSDERRAIHDAVVQAAPSFHDLSDLALPISGTYPAEEHRKTRLEVLAELRDVKRRRTKYRVAANTNNYSHVLSELIKTQMDFFTASVGVKNEQATNEHNLHGNVKNESMVDNEYNKNMQRLEIARANEDKLMSADDKKRFENRNKNRFNYYEPQHSKKKRTDDDPQHNKRRQFDDKPQSSKKRRFDEKSEHIYKSYDESKHMRDRMTEQRNKDERYMEDSITHRKKHDKITSYNHYYDKRKSHSRHYDYKDESKYSYYKEKHYDKYEKHGHHSTDQSQKLIRDNRDGCSRDSDMGSRHTRKHKKHC